jgi:DNA-binding CsgD family transcriptional regulator
LQAEKRDTRQLLITHPNSKSKQGMDKNQSQDKEILRQLTLTNRLLGVLVSLNVQDTGLTLSETVRLLNRAGLAPSEIASILGTSAHNVSVALYQSKKRPAKRAQEDSTQ